MAAQGQDWGTGDVGLLLPSLGVCFTLQRKSDPVNPPSNSLILEQLGANPQLAKEMGGEDSVLPQGL